MDSSVGVGTFGDLVRGVELGVYLDDPLTVATIDQVTRVPVGVRISEVLFSISVNVHPVALGVAPNLMEPFN
eukprot:jgi/Chrzof1/8263/Cz03g03180.t1